MIIRRILDALEPEPVYAHCDIPCGIYDPHEAQVSAHTVARMMDLIHELKAKEGSDEERQNSFVRYVKVKEDHAERCKHEVRVIWGDYFKEEHAKAHPELHPTVWRIMKLASKCRQGVDRRAAEDLVAEVNKFADLFWKTKEKSTATVTAPFQPNKPMVVPVLK